MAGTRWRVEPQLRYTPVDSDAPYYWTSVYYYENLSADPFHGDNYNAILDATLGGSLDDVAMVSVRITDITTSTEYGIVTVGPPFGELPSEGGGSLINVVRLSGRVGEREVSHKLWRFPLRLEDIEGDLLSPSAMDVVNDVIIPNLSLAALCNVHGVSVDSWVCDGRVHNWQTRHGTKRRTRVVYEYP